MAEGEFHESLNLAALWKLPVLFLCENNLYAMGTALERHQAQTDIRRKADGYGMRGGGGGRHGRARRRGGGAARGGARPRAVGGPFLLEARTYRFRAHSMYDPELYRAKEEVEEWKRRDPIAGAARRGSRATGSSPTRSSTPIGAAVDAEIAEAVAVAEAGPWEPVEDLAAGRLRERWP